MDRKELKLQAKQAMRAARPAPFWVALVLVGIMVALSVLSMSLDGTLESVRIMYNSALEGEIVYAEPAPSGLAAGLLSLALEIMSIEMGVGFVLYAMRVWRREKAGCGDLFDGFGVFFRAIWISFLPQLLTLGWSLIYVLPASVLVVMTGDAWWLAVCLPLLIPAIMAEFSYRQAVYIMLDNPGTSCWRCVQLSRQMMSGHKWQSFVLDLSFLGWELLCAVPVAGQILLVWLMAYMQVVYAGYYSKLSEDFAGRIAQEQPPVA